MKVHIIFLVTVLCSALGIRYNAKNSYIAAVVDYNHKYADYPKELLNINVEQYVKIMKNASDEYVDIIVFPEFGLVDIFKIYEIVYDKKDLPALEDYSSFVPDPQFNIVPCDFKDNYSVQLVNISCTARLHLMYTVFNLLEKSYNDVGKIEFYNTNVVLDRVGTVIAKYRKINLSEEPFFKAGDKLVTFTTDFNVTFGIFTCFDILFHYPAIDVLSIPEVTDIIFTTAWFSETPFLQALSIQHGYVKANGVNLLASGLQEPLNKDGGSGIYLADGSIAEMYITNTKGSKLLIQNVPFIKNRIPASMCQKTHRPITVRKLKISKNQEPGSFTDIDNFLTAPDNMTEYSFYPLSKSGKTARRICNDDEGFCCTFNVVVDNSSPPKPDYTYKLVLYKGLESLSTEMLGGIRVCALVACLNDSDSSCGYKHNTSVTPVIFKSVQLEATVEKINLTYDQPSTLRNDLTPISEYSYCEINLGNGKAKLTMATTAPQDSILTFGIYGRTFSDDLIVTPSDSSPPEPKPLNVTLILIIVSFSTLIIITTGGLLYKFCTKTD